MPSQKYIDVMNRVCKWRIVFASKWLGTRSANDPVAQSVKDFAEARILQRIEVTALVSLLTEKGVFTTKEFEDKCIIEAEFLDSAFEARFPGFKSGPAGMIVETAKAVVTAQGWPK